MKIQPNPFKTALAEAPPLLGIWSMLNASLGVEAIGASGFDWVLLDGEHSPLELADAISHLQVLAALNTIPMVRLANNDPILLKRYLDGGAATIMLPNIQSVEGAKAAVSAMHYPPAGTRGVAAMHRASRFGRTSDYLKTATDSLCLIVQLETPIAIDRLEEIAAVPGVDALFIGPSDLSATMGHLGAPDHPKVQEVILGALERAKRLAKPIGVLAANPEAAERFISAGFDFVSVANDLALLVQSADATAAHYRKMTVRQPGEMR